ncbi:2OG-Fe(II) oxygenase superfamily protein [Metarhizium rileyi]|uniref:2OG-Fe(II) oxygenase superfamily protein n=1 Tax=Metarhizium rileyi (strain RCEF 4871) TaxID=1649241 RepID=A0A162J2H5_METRR|nr:2OG-Fe(II) oxygenase superfamily protein [Metarhizium rileyi RCEF 4871]
MTAETIQLKLRFGDEWFSYSVSSKPPRNCTNLEVPLVDLANLEGSAAQRKVIADALQQAAETSGFFYIKNHGIPPDVIQEAQIQAKRFFSQPVDMKMLALQDASKGHRAGWRAPNTSHVCPSEKSVFRWRYSPEHDPLYDHDQLDPQTISQHSEDEPHVWAATAHLKNFKVDSLAYWRSCLNLARKLLPLFAISLSLPETYFDSMATFPEADGLYNFYPATKAGALSGFAPDTEGLGSHTDFQCFTILWQDQNGGLQAVTPENEWIWVTPVEGTLVVNIGDFFRRLTNDRYKSAIHRAYNQGLGDADRISMPFFFGFNSDAECAVFPSCIDDLHPEKYKPITYGQVISTFVLYTKEYDVLLTAAHAYSGGSYGLAVAQQLQSRHFAWYM